MPLRLHHARSVDPTNGELVEICAAQRTFEGAYIRTLLSQSSIALVVLKVFTSEFYSIGASFAVYGAGVSVASAYRRQQGNRQFVNETESVGGGDGAPVGVVGRKTCSLKLRPPSSKYLGHF